MPFWDRLSGTKRWAAGGGVSEPSDAQATQGFAHLANGKPTVEGFNALFQILDDKDNWFFRQVRGVFSRAGMVPNETGDNQLADALRMLATRPWWFRATAGNTAYVVPTGIEVVFALAVGGGGASYGADAGGVRCGSGGGGGGAALGPVSVTAGQSIACAIGAGGLVSGPGLAAGNGGMTSFGSFLSASGGFGGIDLAGGAGGGAVGGTINLQGGSGGDGNASVTAIGTGWGGSAALLGGGSRPGTFAGGGTSAPSATPGSGGAGPYGSQGSYLPGTPGRAGCILVVPIA